VTIRKAIADEIRRAGWSQAELAKRSGIPQQNISEYLRGVRDLTTERASRLLTALRLTVSAE